MLKVRSLGFCFRFGVRNEEVINSNNKFYINYMNVSHMIVCQFSSVQRMITHHGGVCVCKLPNPNVLILNMMPTIVVSTQTQIAKAMQTLSMLVCIRVCFGVYSLFVMSGCM